MLSPKVFEEVSSFSFVKGSVACRSIAWVGRSRCVELKMIVPRSGGKFQDAAKSTVGVL